MIKAIIFDMDGVIVDSESIHLQAENEVLKGFGKSLSKAEKARYIGLKTEDFFSELKKRLDIQASLDELVKKHNKIDLQLLKELAKPMAGVETALKELSNIYKIGLASSSEKVKIRAIIEKLNLTGYFQAAVSAEEVERGKPYPDVYLEAARRLGVEPVECIAIEDSAKGVKSAKAAGMTVIAVPNPHTKQQDMSEADILVSSLIGISKKIIEQQESGVKNIKSN